MSQGCSQKLLQNRGKIAARGIERLLSKRPELKKSLNRIALLKMHSDLSNSIAHLSGSLVVDDPDLFQDHIKWTEHYYRHRGIRPDILADQLEALSESISEFESYLEDSAPREALIHGMEWLHQHNYSVITDVEIPMCPEALEYTRILLDGDRQRAKSFIHDLKDAKWKTEEITTDVVQAAMYEIGRLWHTNQISSRRENTASKINRSVIMGLFSRSETDRPGEAKGICALYSPSGELHDLGIAILGEILKEHGLDVRKYGPNIPDHELINCLMPLKPDVMAVSITMAYDLAHLELLFDKIRSIEELGGMKIVVGGYMASKLKSAEQLSGADVIARNLNHGIDSILKAVQVE
jgi:MerR family transcriptional regulator, light-induced transcriptional regulator